MIRHYEAILEAALENGGEVIDELRILSEEEERQLLEEWNGKKREYGEQRCVHEIFEEEARERGEAVAWEMSGEQVTYGEVNRRANQIGNKLRRRGVGLEEQVGVWMGR